MRKRVCKTLAILLSLVVIVSIASTSIIADLVDPSTCKHDFVVKLEPSISLGFSYLNSKQHREVIVINTACANCGTPGEPDYDYDDTDHHSELVGYTGGGYHTGKYHVWYCTLYCDVCNSKYAGEIRQSCSGDGINCPAP